MVFKLLAAGLLAGSFVTFDEQDGYFEGQTVSPGVLNPETPTEMRYVELNSVDAVITNGALGAVQPSGVGQAAWIRDQLTVGYSSSFARSADIDLLNTEAAWVNISLLPANVSVSYNSLSVTEFNTYYILDCLVRDKTQTTGEFLVRRHDSNGNAQGLNPSTGAWGSNVYTEFDITHKLRVSYEYDHTLLSNQLFMTVYNVTASNLLVNVKLDLGELANAGGTNTVRMVAGDLFSSSIGEGDFCLDNLRSQSGPEVVTIGGGGHVQELVVDASGTMWLGTGVSGLFKSEDGGDSWENCQGLPGWWIQGIAVCDDYPETVYAATEDGLYLSEDDGQTWSDAGLQGNVCSAVAVTKTSSGDRVVMAGVGDVLHYDTGGDGKIYRSVNGAAFTESSIGMQDTNKPIYSIVMHPDAGTVYVSTGDGIYATLNGGSSWDDVTRNLPHRACREMRHKPGAYTDLLVALADDGVAGGGIYRKKWGDTDWTDYSGNLPTNDTYYSVIAGLSTSYDQTMMAIRQSGEGGVFKTTDGGQTWSEVFINNISETGWITWPKIKFFGLAEDASGNVYAGGQGVLYKTTDSGSSWTQSYTVKQATLAGSGWVDDGSGNGYSLKADSWSDAGMVNSYPRMVAVDGSNLYYAVADRGMFFSADNGQSFRSTAFRVNGDVAGDLFAVRIDPFDPQIIYATPAVGYSSSGGAGAIMVSTNQALSWDLLAGTTNQVGGLDGSDEIRDLAFYSGGGVNEFEMYAAVLKKGIYTSSDGGKNWSYAGLDGKNVLSVAVNPNNPDMILVATSDPWASARGLWKGVRSGGAWEFTQKFNDAKGWSVVAKDYQTYFAGCVHASSTTTGGVFRTVNWGGSWENVSPSGALSAGEGVKAVCYDHQADKLYAATNHQIWMSEDEGDNWTDLKFFGQRGKIHVNGLSVQNLGSQRFLYVATNGKGVWRKELGPNL